MKTISLLTLNFAQHCSLINSNSKTPSGIPRKTDKFLPNITFSGKDIRKIIQRLNSNKVHGHKLISIRMLQTCGASI